VMCAGFEGRGSGKEGSGFVNRGKAIGIQRKGIRVAHGADFGLTGKGNKERRSVFEKIEQFLFHQMLLQILESCFYQNLEMNSIFFRFFQIFKNFKFYPPVLSVFVVIVNHGSDRA
jgi:hypothetical protein